jgi:hypothetical protein
MKPYYMMQSLSVMIVMEIALREKTVHESKSTKSTNLVLDGVNIKLTSEDRYRIKKSNTSHLKPKKKRKGRRT